MTVEDVERLLVSGSGGSGWGTGAGVGVGALGGPKSTRAVACVTVPTLPCAGAELSRVAALRCFAPGAAEKRYVAVDAPLVALVQPGLAHRAPMELLHDRCALVGPPGNAVCSHVGTHFQAHQCPPPPGAPLARLDCPICPYPGSQHSLYVDQVRVVMMPRDVWMPRVAPALPAHIQTRQPAIPPLPAPSLLLTPLKCRFLTFPPTHTVHIVPSRRVVSGSLPGLKTRGYSNPSLCTTTKPTRNIARSTTEGTVSTPAWKAHLTPASRRANFVTHPRFGLLQVRPKPVARCGRRHLPCGCGCGRRPGRFRGRPRCRRRRRPSLALRHARDAGAARRRPRPRRRGNPPRSPGQRKRAWMGKARPLTSRHANTPCPSARCAFGPPGNASSVRRVPHIQARQHSPSEPSYSRTTSRQCSPGQRTTRDH